GKAREAQQRHPAQRLQPDKGDQSARTAGMSVALPPEHAPRQQLPQQRQGSEQASPRQQPCQRQAAEKIDEDEKDKQQIAVLRPAIDLEQAAQLRSYDFVARLPIAEQKATCVGAGCGRQRRHPRLFLHGSLSVTSRKDGTFTSV